MNSPMGHGAICSVVAGRAGVAQAQADSAVTAVLQALAEQTGAAGFEQLLPELPPKLTQIPQTEQNVHHRTMTDFLARVTELDGSAPQQVHRLVLAVLAALQMAVKDRTLHMVLEPLGPQFTDLLPPPTELNNEEAFVRSVRERGAMANLEEAQSATVATLTPLAERVTAGQAHNVATFLAAPLAPALHPAEDRAQPFDYNEFLRGIAAQRRTAEARARAVLSTLREAVPEVEIAKMREQLPRDLSQLFD